MPWGGARWLGRGWRTRCLRMGGCASHDPADLRLCLVGDMSGGAARDLLVLWDVDGTLLNAGGVGADMYSAVFLQLFGRSLETTAPMAGRTDRAIVLETLTLAGVPEPRRHVDPFIAGLAAQAPAVRTSVAARGRALPGAAAALAALASRTGAPVGAHGQRPRGGRGQARRAGAARSAGPVHRRLRRRPRGPGGAGARGAAARRRRARALRGGRVQGAWHGRGG